MAELSVQQIDIDGLDPSFPGADVGGDSFLNDGDTVLYVKNDDSAEHTVTLEIQKSVDFGSLTNPTVTVPAGEERIIGPFNREWFNDSDKYAHVSYDAVTSVTVAALKV